MKSKQLRFRQIHLDFHTSPLIPGIASAFEKKRWQETLRMARVNSITCFSKCHHGVSYHPTQVGQMHPQLSFDLLRAQMDACKEIDVQVPIYLSAGVDNTITQTQPGWREIDCEGRLAGWSRSPLQPGFHKLCFNSPYLDYLCRQIEEAVTLFPEADGVFLDIIAQGQCCCNWCMEAMAKHGLDPEKESDRKENARLALDRYYRATVAAAKCRDAAMPIFHNSGHITRGDRGVVGFQSHLELESLPTGGWGYDHFPESASYVAHLGLDYLGMTGKFHRTWGEFGGFKHPNALRYECGAMMAFGAKCSIGDQLHPDGGLDASTYALIGAAYSEVEAKEPWCEETVAIADIGVLSSEAENGPSPQAKVADTGASRILLEGHHLFALIDRDVDFAQYKLLILPDDISIDPELKSRIDTFLAKGGKLLLTGRSGLVKGSEAGFAWDLGADYSGPSPYNPDFVLPAPEYRSEYISTPAVSYSSAQRIKATHGQSLGQVFDPYFNRTYQHFCSHFHTPFRPEPSGFDSGVLHGAIAYLAHPVFSVYHGFGAVAHKLTVLRVIEALLGGERTVTSNLPSSARLTLRRQPAEKRQVLHLMYANKQLRGAPWENCGIPLPGVEVIEDLDSLRQVKISIRPGTTISRVSLEPGGEAMEFEQQGDRLHFTVEEFSCHQMVVLHEA